LGGISWTKYSAAAKHPCLGGIPWTKYSAATKHPCLGGISWTKYYGTGKMSWKAPQNLEETQTQEKKLLPGKDFYRF
jgi:hypothetical protein